MASATSKIDKGMYANIDYHIFKFSEAVVQRCSVKKVLLEISQNSQENTCRRCQHLSRHLCFPVNFAKFLRTLFFTEHLRWLLLDYHNFKFSVHQ